MFINPVFLCDSDVSVPDMDRQMNPSVYKALRYLVSSRPEAPDLGLPAGRLAVQTAARWHYSESGEPSFFIPVKKHFICMNMFLFP